MNLKRREVIKYKGSSFVIFHECQWLDFGQNSQATSQPLADLVHLSVSSPIYCLRFGVGLFLLSPHLRQDRSKLTEISLRTGEQCRQTLFIFIQTPGIRLVRKTLTSISI